MLTRSALFDSSLIAGPSQSVVTATLLRRGVPFMQVPLLPGATVTLDETQAVRRTLSCTIADDGTLAPHLPTDPLAPYGVEMYVQSGLVRTDGVTEQVDAGYFRLMSVDTTTLGLITIDSAPDRSAVVSAALNEAPFVIPPNTPLDTAIEAYLGTKYPSLPFQADAFAHGCSLGAAPTVFQEGSTGDPFSDCIKMANQFGRELFINASGVAILRVIPNPMTAPLCWQYQPGEMNLATLGTNSFDTTPGGVYNVFVVSSSGTAVSPPVSATVEITDPTSPIYPDLQGFGRRPFFYSSSELTTAAQCVTAAEGLMALNAGKDRNPSFSAVPHPAHEPGDVVNYTSSALGIGVNVCLSSWTLQLDLMAAANYTTRQASTTVVTSSS